jgi:hypothetical protein
MSFAAHLQAYCPAITVLDVSAILVLVPFPRFRRELSFRVSMAKIEQQA